MKNQLIIIDKPAVYNNGITNFDVHILNLENGWYYVKYLTSGVMSYINENSNIKFTDRLNSQAFNFDNDPPVI